MIEDAGGSDNKLNQAQFVSMMVKLKTSTPTRRELTDSFAVFDKSGSKNINCKEFKKAMKEMGATPMKDSEVDKFIAHANPEDTSGFSYDALIEVMASQKADKIPWMEKAPSE
jgi:Ca2+-binding EF-hand superfamily protein